MGLDVDSLQPDPVESARQAGLRYVTDETPGITRKRWGRGFTYLDAKGQHIRDPQERERMAALAIPPAWDDVWIAPGDDYHILATGRDEKGRKQYIYHPQWHEVREETKFQRMVAFGEALPLLRRRAAEEMELDGLPRARVLAAVITLMDRTLVRVGNREYARTNSHYGLTTLRDRHVRIRGAKLHFEFTGKSGKELVIELSDQRLARIVKACREVPGHHLFQYVDEHGERRAVSSNDVNDYLREATGADFTAKDFRTWGGTVLAIVTLLDCGPCEDEATAKRNILKAVDTVAEQLNNTRAVCRRYYIHPGVLDCYEKGTMAEMLSEPAEQVEGLEPEECAMLSLLQRLYV